MPNSKSIDVKLNSSDTDDYLCNDLFKIEAVLVLNNQPDLSSMNINDFGVQFHSRVSSKYIFKVIEAKSGDHKLHSVQLFLCGLAILTKNKNIDGLLISSSSNRFSEKIKNIRFKNGLIITAGIKLFLQHAGFVFCTTSLEDIVLNKQELRSFVMQIFSSSTSDSKGSAA